MTTLKKHRGRFFDNVIALLGSLTFHAALIAFGFFAYRSVKTYFELRHEQLYIPSASLIASESNLADKVAGNSNLADLPTQMDIPDAAADGSNIVAGRDRHSLDRSMNPPSNDEAAFDQVIGVGIRSGGVRGNGPETGGGPLAPFGAINQIGGSPNIFTRGTLAARSVVFLCDASGSMLPKFADLRRELAKAIEGLKPSQSFGITFFNQGPATSLSPRLLMVNPENKMHGLDFLENVTPRGTTDPLPGLDAAFRQKPELIFLLTDGDFPDNDAVLARIRLLNKDQRVKINTIAFVNEADTDTAFMALLKQIAQESSGVYRYVKQDQLN